MHRQSTIWGSLLAVAIPVLQATRAWQYAYHNICPPRPSLPRFRYSALPGVAARLLNVHPGLQGTAPTTLMPAWLRYSMQALASCDEPSEAAMSQYCVCEHARARCVHILASSLYNLSVLSGTARLRSAVGGVATRPGGHLSRHLSGRPCSCRLQQGMCWSHAARCVLLLLSAV
jgi:hypothetical protein